MQYMITAYDATDEGALQRRMEVRPRHLENITKVKEYGSVISAGGILDQDGRMIGSFLILEFAERAFLEQYLESEPYLTEHVWETVKVEVCNVVIMRNEWVERQKKGDPEGETENEEAQQQRVNPPIPPRGRAHMGGRRRKHRREPQS